MPGEYEVVTIDRLNGGQVVALFERELSKVLENIADENTPAKAPRGITITIKIKPEDDRATTTVEIEAHAKLASVKPSRSFMVLGYDGNKVTAYQSDPKQQKLGLEEEPANVSKFPGQAAGGK